MKRISFYFLQITLGLILVFGSEAGEASVCAEFFGAINKILRNNETNHNSRKIRHNKKRSSSEEADLVKKGHRSIYTQGLDHALELIALGKKLRANKIDPYKTHIPEFADSIQKHIDFIHQSLLSRKKENTDFRMEEVFDVSLKILKEIKQEALEKIKNKQVTYEWNVKINMFLALISDVEVFQIARRFQPLKKKKNKNKQVTYEWNVKINNMFLALISDVKEFQIKRRHFQSLKNWKNLKNHPFHNREIQEVVAKFPKVINFPTIKKMGIMGIMGFNRSFIEGINFVGLTGGYDSYTFFTHDLLHGEGRYQIIVNTERQKPRKFLESWKRQYLLLEKKFENLPLREREMVEMIYFMISHENDVTTNFLEAIYDPVSLSGGFVRAEIINELTGLFHNPFNKEDLEFKNFLPKDIRWGSKNEIRNYIEESFDVFVGLFEQILMLKP